MRIVLITIIGIATYSKSIAQLQVNSSTGFLEMEFGLPRILYNNNQFSDAVQDHLSVSNGISVNWFLGGTNQWAIGISGYGYVYGPINETELIEPLINQFGVDILGDILLNSFSEISLGTSLTYNMPIGAKFWVSTSTTPAMIWALRSQKIYTYRIDSVAYNEVLPPKIGWSITQDLGVHYIFDEIDPLLSVRVSYELIYGIAPCNLIIRYAKDSEPENQISYKYNEKYIIFRNSIKLSLRLPLSIFTNLSTSDYE